MSKVTVREIYSIDVKYFSENKLKIYIRGSAFLKSQVRIMVGTALEVYYKNLPKNHIDLMLMIFQKSIRKVLLKLKDFT